MQLQYLNENWPCDIVFFFNKNFCLHFYEHHQKERTQTDKQLYLSIIDIVISTFSLFILYKHIRRTQVYASANIFFPLNFLCLFK